MNTQFALSDDDIIRIVKAYYAAIDSLDATRIADAYLDAPSTTLQFNADAPIVATTAIREFSAQLCQAVSGIRHTMIEVWKTPLMGKVVPVDQPSGRPDTSVTVVSTALPTFSVGNGASATQLSLPATSIFTIDTATGKFLSVHNMFDIGKVYAAIGG